MTNGQTVEVKISLTNGNIAVAPDPFWLHKLQDQCILWKCDQDFSVEFDPHDCPFYEYQFSQDYPCSGIVRRSVVTDDHKIYKYTVRVGGVVLDPGGGVKK